MTILSETTAGEFPGIWLGRDHITNDEVIITPNRVTDHLTIVGAAENRAIALKRIIESALNNRVPALVVLRPENRDLAWLFQKQDRVRINEGKDKKVHVVDLQYDSYDRYYSDFQDWSHEEILKWYEEDMPFGEPFDIANLLSKVIPALKLAIQLGKESGGFSPSGIRYFCMYPEELLSRLKDVNSEVVTDLEGITKIVYPDDNHRRKGIYGEFLENKSSLSGRHPHIFLSKNRSITIERMIATKNVMFIIAPDNKDLNGFVFRDFMKTIVERRVIQPVFGIFDAYDEYQQKWILDKFDAAKVASASLVLSSNQKAVHLFDHVLPTTLSQVSNSSTVFNLFDGDRDILVDMED